MSEHRMTRSRTGAKIRRWLGCLSLGLLMGCQAGGPNTARTGALRISVQFPPQAQQDFQTKLIRPETRAIYVAVYQHDLSQDKPQIYGPITPQNPTVRLNQLEAGEQTVIAAAYDEQNQILTAGESLAIIKPNALSQASLELESDYRAHLRQDQLSFLQKLQLPKGNLALNTDLQPLPSTTVPVFQSNQTVAQPTSTSPVSSAQLGPETATDTPVTPVTPASGINSAAAQRLSAQDQQPEAQTIQTATAENSGKDQPSEPTTSATPVPAATAEPAPSTAPTAAPSASPSAAPGIQPSASPSSNGNQGQGSNNQGNQGNGNSGNSGSNSESSNSGSHSSGSNNSGSGNSGSGHGNSGNSGKDKDDKKDDGKSNNGNHYGADNGKGSSGNSGKGGGKDD